MYFALHPVLDDTRSVVRDGSLSHERRTVCPFSTLRWLALHWSSEGCSELNRRGCVIDQHDAMGHFYMYHYICSLAFVQLLLGPVQPINTLSSGGLALGRTLLWRVRSVHRLNDCIAAVFTKVFERRKLGKDRHLGTSVHYREASPKTAPFEISLFNHARGSSAEVIRQLICIRTYMTKIILQQEK